MPLIQPEHEGWSRWYLLAVSNTLTGFVAGRHGPPGPEDGTQRRQRVVGQPAAPDEVPDGAGNVAVAGSREETI